MVTEGVKVSSGRRRGSGRVSARGPGSAIALVRVMPAAPADAVQQHHGEHRTLRESGHGKFLEHESEGLSLGESTHRFKRSLLSCGLKDYIRHGCVCTYCADTTSRIAKIVKANATHWYTNCYAHK